MKSSLSSEFLQSHSPMEAMQLPRFKLLSLDYLNPTNLTLTQN